MSLFLLDLVLSNKKNIWKGLFSIFLPSKKNILHLLKRILWNGKTISLLFFPYPFQKSKTHKKNNIKRKIFIMIKHTKEEYYNMNKKQLQEKRMNSRGQEKVLLNLILTEE